MIELNENSLPEGFKPIKHNNLAPVEKAVTPHELIIIESDAKYEDYIGIFDWKGENQLTSEGYPNEGRLVIMPYYYFDDDDTQIYVENYYEIYGLIKNIWLYGYFQNGVLLIPDQKIAHHDTYGDLWFYNYYPSIYTTLDDENHQVPEYRLKRNTSNPFYFEFNKQGKLVSYRIDQDLYDKFYYAAPELMQFVRIGAVAIPDYSSDLFFWLCSWIEGDRYEDFAFNEKEWTYGGEAMYMDPWLLFETFGQYNEEYPVPFYVNKQNKHLLLLKEPYGANTPYGEQFDTSKPGHVLLDISDPSFVKAMIRVRAGSFKSEDKKKDDGIYCFNLESFYTDLMDWDKEITREFLMEFDGKISNFSPITNKIEIQYPVHWMTWYDLMTWGSFPGKERLDGYIVLPKSYDSGFEDASVDMNSFSEGISVESGKGFVNISSDTEKKVNIYSIDGRIVKTINSIPETTTISLTPGVYIIAGKKIMIN